MRLVPAVRRDACAHPGDYGLAGIMAGVALVALVSRIDVEDADLHRFHPDTWWAGIVTIVICALLVGRRRWPLRTLAAGLVLVLPLEAARQRDVVAFFAVVVLVYSVAAHLPPRLAWRGMALVAGLYAVLLAGGIVILSPVPLLGPGFLGAAFALGTMIRRGRAHQRREVDAAIEQAAAAIETAELEAADERLRMAQELHDVVAHSLSVIAVQAGIGAHLIGRRPAEAALALDAIRTTCDATDGELGRLVAVLRHGGPADTPPGTAALSGTAVPPGTAALSGTTVPSGTATTPGTATPALADAGALVEQIRLAGVAVTLVVGGDLAALPDGVSLAAYRIVQEALTNVVRHAGPAAVATVTIGAGAGHIELVIDDDGRGVTGVAAGGPGGPDGADRGGNGLLGMTERARMYGGDVEAGPRPGGGFRVRATLDAVVDAGPGSGPGVSPGPGVAPRIGAAAPADRGVGPVSESGTSAGRWGLSPPAWDAVLAVVMAAVAMVEVVTADAAATGPQFTPTHLGATLLRLGCAATLALRRRYPGLAYVVAWLFALVLSVGDYQVGVIVFVLWIGLYSIAAYAPRWQLVAAVVGSGAGLVAVAWSEPPDLTRAGAAWAAVFLAASALAGHVVRRDRDRRHAELGERSDAASARTRHARLVVANERLRMADELSTVVTRSIHTIAVHAASGAPLVATDPARAGDALEAISHISRDALGDLRRLLAHMRATGGSASLTPAVSASLTPAVSAGDVPVPDPGPRP